MSSGVHSPDNRVSSTLKNSQVKSGLVPTNSVTLGDGVTVRARIEPTLTVEDVIKQLCMNLQIKDPEQYALRGKSDDDLVTNDNLRRKIKTKSDLKLVSSPAREAKETAEKLELRDEKTTRLTLFSLQKFIREEQFSKAFLQFGGLGHLVDVIFTSSGNTLAYALTAMQNLMELDYGWDQLDDQFILRVVQILSSAQSLINVCRPATAILKKLVEADPISAPGPPQPSSSRDPHLGSVYQYGFAVVFEQMRKESGFLETVVSRLGSADTAMAQHSMMLINSLLSHASDVRWIEFITDLERLNLGKVVVRLMSLHTVEDLTSCILDFQANMVRVAYRKKTTQIDIVNDSLHATRISSIWTRSKLQEDKDAQGNLWKWRQLGFDSEDITQEFSGVGYLGLECLENLFEADPDFSKVILEQLSRPVDRRCPIAKASNEVVELLSEHWAIFAPGYSTSTTFQPLFLEAFKVHTVAIKFFIRMWSESSASYDDFNRVVALVRSQIKFALKGEDTRSWHEVERDFLECEYRAVRDRQMKELELEDDFLSKIPVRNLRNKLYKESFEFVRQQRIQCLLQGAWFINGMSLSSPREQTPRWSRLWRFMRLDSGHKNLHYVESSFKFPVRNGLEDLPERIDVSMISEITTKTCVAPSKLLRNHADLPLSDASALSFSLHSAHEGSLADLIASDEHQWADWMDGLNMLRRDGGHFTSKETADFVHALTDIGLRVKLLDLSGDMVEMPSGLVAGPPPSNTDFYFGDVR